VNGNDIPLSQIAKTVKWKHVSSDLMFRLLQYSTITSGSVGDRGRESAVCDVYDWVNGNARFLDVNILIVFECNSNTSSMGIACLSENIFYYIILFFS
jgi:hypothetical protein